MTTTRFIVWRQDPLIQPDRTGIVIVGSPEYDDAGVVDITVEGNGSELRRLIAKGQDIFVAYLQMQPEQPQTKG